MGRGKRTREVERKWGKRIENKEIRRNIKIGERRNGKKEKKEGDNDE